MQTYLTQENFEDPLSSFYWCQFKTINVRKIEKLDMTELSTLDTPYLFSSEHSNDHPWVPQKSIFELLNLSLSVPLTWI